MLYSSANDGMNDELLPGHAQRLDPADTTHLNYHDIAGWCRSCGTSASPDERIRARSWSGATESSRSSLSRRGRRPPRPMPFTTSSAISIKRAV